MALQAWRSCFEPRLSRQAPLCSRSSVKSLARNESRMADVVILSNGPGEVATWVKPVVKALRENLDDIRISVVLSPCPHASGGELELISKFEEVDRCQGPEAFWQLLLGLGAWPWHSNGVCIFLGGDQFNAVLLSWRLGFKTIVYAETSVRWPRFVDRYLLRHRQLLERLPKWAKEKCLVIGDLCDDAVSNSAFVAHKLGGCPVVGILPGSKAAKLLVGIPFFMSAAEHLSQRMQGHVKFILPLAPTLKLSQLARCADAASNPIISRFGWTSGVLQSEEHRGALGEGKLGKLITGGGVEIEIWQQFPPYSLYKRCDLCLTTVGANTAELSLLSVPMIMVLTTHALEAFRGGTGGILGVLSSFPGWIGEVAARSVNVAILRSLKFLAWPNRWAGKQIVPEMVGKIEPEQVSKLAAYYLQDINALTQLKLSLDQLKESRSSSCFNGHTAASKMAAVVCELLQQSR